MTVKQLKNILEEYDENAEVIGVDFSTGSEFDISVGSDDEDEYIDYCRIGIG